VSFVDTISLSLWPNYKQILKHLSNLTDEIDDNMGIKIIKLVGVQRNTFPAQNMSSNTLFLVIAKI